MKKKDSGKQKRKKPSSEGRVAKDARSHKSKKVAYKSSKRKITKKPNLRDGRARSVPKHAAKLVDHGKKLPQRSPRSKQFDLCTTLVKMWEQLRLHRCSNRAQVLENILAIVKGRVKEFAFKHNTARVLQAVLKYGSAQQRLVIYDELKDSLLELAKCKYSKFLVKKLLSCCPKKREEILSCFHGHVTRLIKHTEAASVLEIAYSDYANTVQREALTREFYGVVTLGDETQFKLRRLKELIMSLLNKEALKHSIVHKPLLDYLTMSCDPDRADMIQQLRERLVELLQTKDGAKVTMQCIWHGTAKDRKIIIKSFKTFVKKIAMEEYGHFVLLAIFDCVDDTVLVKKVIISELIKDLAEVASDKYGRRVLLYLLSPRDPNHFNPSMLSILTPGDDNPHSKKPREERSAELREVVSPGLVEFVADRAAEWIRDKSLSQFVLAIAQHSTVDCAAIMEGILPSLEQPFDEEAHIIADACGHFAIRKLLIIQNNRLEVDTVFFAKLITSRVPHEELQRWATINRGAFVLASLASSKVKGVSKTISSQVLPPSVREQWRESELKGHEALLIELV